MSGTRAISTKSRRELSSNFLFLKGVEPKEIHAILTETLAFFLPGQAKDLSASLYIGVVLFRVNWHADRRRRPFVTQLLREGFLGSNQFFTETEA